MKLFGYLFFIVLSLYTVYLNIRLTKSADYKKYSRVFDDLYPIRDRTLLSSQKVITIKFRDFFMAYSIDELKFQKSELKAIIDDMKQYSVMSIGITILLAFVGYIFNGNRSKSFSDISIFLYLISIFVVLMYILKHFAIS